MIKNEDEYNEHLIGQQIDPSLVENSNLFFKIDEKNGNSNISLKDLYAKTENKERGYMALIMLRY